MRLEQELRGWPVRWFLDPAQVFIVGPHENICGSSASRAPAEVAVAIQAPAFEKLAALSSRTRSS